MGFHGRVICNGRPALDMFNIGNVNTTTAQVETVGAALDRPAGIFAPRLFKLGVKVGF